MRGEEELRFQLLGRRVAVSAVVVGLLAVFVPSSFANVVYPVADTFGSFGDPAGMAFDASDQSLFVIDRSDASVRKFDVGGGSPVPADFSALGSSRLDGSAIPGVGAFSFDSPAQLAVDQSGGATDGYLYVADGLNNAVEVFDSSGAFVGRIDETPAGPLGDPMGVAVDGSGNVYVAAYYAGAVSKFDSTAATDDLAAYQGSVSGPEVGNPGAIAVDSVGGVYVSPWFGPTAKFNASDFTPDPGDDIGTPVDAGAAAALAVNPSNDHLFVGHGSDIVEYDESGVLVGTSTQGFGATGGLAVDGSNDLLFVSDAANGRGVVLGPSATADTPTALVDPPSPITPSGAHVTGTVNPGGSGPAALTSWYFEYSIDGGGSWTMLGAPSLLGGASDYPVFGDIDGLLPNQDVLVRLVASNAAGTITTDPPQGFTTETIAPTLDATGPVAAQVTTSSARLRGSVNPNNSTTVYRFEYVDDDQYQVDGFASASVSPDPDSDIGSAPGDQPVATSIDGLVPGTLYHYRVVASNIGGQAQGSEATFATAPATPAGATDMTAATATLTGTVNNHNTPATYWFEYGKTTNYGNTTAETNVAAASGDQPVTKTVSGLQPNATYHVRVITTINGVSATGADGTFTTEPGPTAAVTAVTGVGASAATLNGQTDTNGMPATYSFRIAATDSAYTTTTTPAPVPDSGTVSAQVGDLPAGGQFQVTLTVTSNGASTTSASAAFTTPAAPVTPNPARPAEDPDPYNCQTLANCSTGSVSNRFKLNSSVVKGTRRKATLTLTIPRAGVVKVKHRYLKTITKRVKGGRVTITLTLNAAGRKALRDSKTGRRKLVYTIRYTPTGGKTTKQNDTLTFKRKATK